jgi:hypothetical protein
MLRCEGLPADAANRNPPMPLLVPILLTVWLLVVVVAMLLCLSARRSDAEMLGTELAPVVEIKAAALARRHSAA